MNTAILTKLIEQAREHEALLFTLHRDCDDSAEMNLLGAAWISAKEVRVALETIETRRKVGAETAGERDIIRQANQIYRKGPQQ